MKMVGMLAHLKASTSKIGNSLFTDHNQTFCAQPLNMIYIFIGSQEKKNCHEERKDVLPLFCIQKYGRYAMQIHNIYFIV